MKIFVLIIISIMVVPYSTAQKKEDYKPFTIESTYLKLKKDYPEIEPIRSLVSNEIIKHEDVIYKSVNDTQLKLDVYAPKGNHPGESLPAVLLIHGGGWLVGSKENQRVMAQHLALNGYVGITVSYRLGFEAKYPASVIDLKESVIWVKEHAKEYNLDPDKIAVLGASAGGQLATLIGVTPNSTLYETNGKHSDEVQAIINIDGIVSFIHPEAAPESKEGKVSMADIWLNGPKRENFEIWKEASPLEYVGSNTPSILFINSSQPRFHAGRDDMIAILNKHEIYSEVHTLEKSPHAFWLVHPWFETTIGITVDFLNKRFKT